MSLSRDTKVLRGANTTPKNPGKITLLAEEQEFVLQNAAEINYVLLQVHKVISGENDYTGQTAEVLKLGFRLGREYERKQCQEKM